jgi:hypothetical protein
MVNVRAVASSRLRGVGIKAAEARMALAFEARAPRTRGLANLLF